MTLLLFPQCCSLLIKKNSKLIGFICVNSVLSSRLKLSFMSVMFDFNDSLNDVAPAFPMLLSVDVKRNEKSDLLMDTICVFFLLSLPPRLSFVSVVFDFNALLNDAAPAPPMLLSVDVMKKEKE